MNRKQTLVFIIFLLIALAVITIPLWIDHVLPYLNSYLRAVAATLERWVDILKKLI
ncbi:MAG: hypothetical protein Q8N79_00410 [Candidatus Methanoperedens sp.]|nr:hypothetical protein [Candidatus Methanoperedens sp.]